MKWINTKKGVLEMKKELVSKLNTIVDWGMFSVGLGVMLASFLVVVKDLAITHGFNVSFLDFLAVYPEYSSELLGLSPCLGMCLGFFVFFSSLNFTVAGRGKSI